MTLHKAATVGCASAFRNDPTGWDHRSVGSRWAWRKCAAMSCVLAVADPAVESGRRALDDWWWRAYPWYDKSNDAARPIDVSERWYDNLDWSWDGLKFSSSLLEAVAWGGLALLAALLIYLVVRTYLARKRAGAKMTTGSPDGEDRRRVEALPAGAARWPADLLAAAARLYQEGDYRRAILYLFSHQLCELDRHHLIRLTKGKTNRQYLRELGRRRPLVVLVQETMVAFERVFFGNHAIDRAAFELCWRRLDEFNALVAGAAS